MARQSVLIRILLVACAVLLVSNVALFGAYYAANNKTVSHRAANYPLLSSRVFIDNPNDALINFVPLRKSLQTKFNALTVQKSFYFEYLPTGTSIRVNDDNELVAASLIKVPMAMNMYKAAEMGKLNLDKKVTITQSELDDAYGDLWKQGAGAQITLRQAAKDALSLSDNTALHVMFDNTRSLLTSDQESLNQLDIDQNVQSGQAVIDAKSYTSILKSLFLSSYLQPRDSQEILTYLTQSTATNRLVAGLPHGIKVAHKIGVNNTNWAESDCGIVYVPKRPYAICVMVGLPEEQANQFIAQVSKEVYDYVSKQ